MARPRKDGTAAREPQRRRLDDRYIKNAKKADRRVLVWDEVQKGLALSIEPSGKKSYKFIYQFGGRPRWLNVGDTRMVSLADARKLVRLKAADVVHGKDPQAERLAQRRAGTFEELAHRYRDEFAKRRNKSWRQADALVERYLMPSLGKMPAANVTRGDIRTIFRRITDDGAPILANQVLAAASAVFTWGIKNELISMPASPTTGVERNKTTSRERVLSDAELPAVWKAFDEAGLIRSAALKLILMCGQRPGEVSHMRHEQLDRGVHRFTDANRRTIEVEGAWWSLPGAADPATGWPGTKNHRDHRVWLTKAALDIIDELGDDATGFVFKGKARNAPAKGLARAMSAVCDAAGVPADNRATPHDLRRSHGTMVTALGFTREMMNRIQNHADGGIASVYDRHSYATELRQIQEAVGARISALVDAKAGDNVVSMARP